MISSKIIDGFGKSNAVKVNDEGEIGVIIHTHPPFKESRTGLPFRQYFTTDGTPSGSNDMRVNGSVSPVEFCIPASSVEDRFIKYVSIKLADAGAKLDKFGSLTALSNGVSFEWISQKVGTLIIHDGLKDNLEFFRLTTLTPTITDLSGGGADAIVLTWDLSKIFGSQWGLKLSSGSTEKLVFRINDNISSGLDEFNIIGHGTSLESFQ